MYTDGVNDDEPHDPECRCSRCLDDESPVVYALVCPHSDPNPIVSGRRSSRPTSAGCGPLDDSDGEHYSTGVSTVPVVEKLLERMSGRGSKSTDLFPTDWS